MGQKYNYIWCAENPLTAAGMIQALLEEVKELREKLKEKEEYHGSNIFSDRSRISG
jgi:hypothetical protein